MPTVLRYTILLLVILKVASSANEKNLERTGLRSFMEKIDRYHRNIDDEIVEDLSLIDDHGHTGHEEDFHETSPSRFTNEWVVKITGGPVAAASIADKMGFEIVGEVS